MNVGTLTISLTARTASLAKAAAGVKAFEHGVVASVQRINASISTMGMAFSALTIPIAAIGIGSTKMFSDFEFNLHRISGLIGKSENQVKQWGKEILSLAPKLGASANEMSKSLYNIITSDPYRSSELNMELLEKSTKAAEAGLGDMEGIARTAAYAMNAFGTANMNVSKAIDTIIFGVKEGVVTSEEYASALGKVLPAAQKVGMQFHEVAAATAAITRTGNNARESITQIRRMLFTLVQAPEKGKKALNEMNSSYSTLIQHIKDKGFLSVLQEIKNMTELKGEDFMSEIFPNIRALLPVIDLLGENFEANVGIFERANTEIGGQLETLWESYTKTMRYAMKKIFSDAGVTAIEFGNQIKNVVIPIMTSLVKMLSSAADWFINLRQEVKENIAKIIILTGVIGPLLILFSSLVSMVINLIKFALLPLRLAFGLLKWAIILVLSPFKKFKDLIIATKAATLSHPIVLLAGALLAVAYAFTKIKETSATWYMYLDRALDNLKIKFLQFKNWLLKTVEIPLLNSIKLVNSLLPQKLQIGTDLDITSKIEENLKVIEELEKELSDKPLVTFKDAVKDTWESMKSDLTKLTDWFVKQWDSMWSKMEPPNFSVPDGTFGPSTPPVEETFDEFMKRITGVRAAVNDYIFDPFARVDKIIKDAEVDLAIFSMRGVEAGENVRLTELTMQRLRKIIDDLNKEPLLNTEQIKQLQNFRIDLNMESMRKSVYQMNADMKKVNEQAKYLSGVWDESGVRIAILENHLRDLLDVDIQGWTEENKQYWANMVASNLEEIRKLKFYQDILNNIATLAGNVSSLFVDLGSVMGEAFQEAVKPLVDFIRALESVFRVIDNVRKISEMLSKAKDKEMATDIAGAATKQINTAATNVNTAAKLYNYQVTTALADGIITENEAALISAAGKELDTAMTKFNTVAKEANAAASGVNATATGAESAADMVDAGAKITDAAATGTNTAAKATNTAAKVANAIASAIEWLVEKLGPIGIIAAIGAVAGIIALFSSGSKKANSAAKMAGGGIVPPGYPNDTYPALLTSGETVTPPGKLPDFNDSFERGPMEIKLNGEWRIKGKDLYYIMREEQRLIGNAFG